ncbi:sodium:solute symporter family transporter [Yinghuangia soli]|uniref:Transporter n=1 Tax=Yinghuangia soli TaxID=2908204 RepID=A0AA41U7A9_9ACTN|nr:transporter [Yinghuangia soli]MCF2533867.1 transporter [Yinghuangia soli]
MLIVGFIIFMVICALLCVLTASDQDDPRADDRPLSAWQHGAVINGECMTAITLLAATGLVAFTGGDGMALPLGMVMGLGLLTLLLAEPLRRAGGRTVADALSMRLPGRSVRIALGLVTLTVCLPFLVLQLTAVGTVMDYLVGLPGTGTRTTSIVLAGGLMVSLALTGGIRGTAVVQLVKVGFLLVVLVVVGALVLHRFGWDGGRLMRAAASGSQLEEAYRGTGVQYGDGAVAVLNRIGLYLTLLVAVAGLPHVTMRVQATAGASDARRSLRWAVRFLLVISALVVLAGVGAVAVLGRDVLVEADPSGTRSLLLLAGALDQRGILLTAIAGAVFLAALAAIADITLAAATSLAHDIVGSSARPRPAAAPRETGLVRGSAAAIGMVTVGCAVAAADWNLLVLSTLALAVSASALTPVLVLGLLWPRFTSRGALCCLYGSTLLVILLVSVSPHLSGTPQAVFPGVDFRWTPLLNPGIVTIPTGFALGWLGSVLGRQPTPVESSASA